MLTGAGLASIVAGAVSSVNNLTNTGTAAALSNFRGNVSNWDYIAEVHDIQGWNDSSADTAEICTWTGMVCGGTGGTQILGLSLPNLGLEGERPQPAVCRALAAAQNAAFCSRPALPLEGGKTGNSDYLIPSGAHTCSMSSSA